MYIINYSAIVESLLSPDKRSPKAVAFNHGLVGEIANNHELLFNTYREGEIVEKWSLNPYNNRDRVKYGNSIFQSAEDSNTSEPTLSDSWRLITDNFLGNDFRIKIRGEKIVLEYALNMWFISTFRQPPLISDIYISTNRISNVDVFRVGASASMSSKVYSNNSSELVINEYTFTNDANMAINVPIVVYNSLAGSNDAREAVIRDFADKYINAGLTYKIITY
jgi:hypothetical protein